MQCTKQDQTDYYDQLWFESVARGYFTSNDLCMNFIGIFDYENDYDNDNDNDKDNDIDFLFWKEINVGKSNAIRGMACPNDLSRQYLRERAEREWIEQCLFVKIR